MPGRHPGATLQLDWEVRGNARDLRADDILILEEIDADADFISATMEAELSHVLYAAGEGRRTVSRSDPLYAKA